MLKSKHLKLDAVVELRVNESALLQRVESRVAEMTARGEQVRADDTPEVLSKRLASYRAQTEPLIYYYSERRKLLTVDGMMTIEHVTRDIDRILAAIGASERKLSKRPEKRRWPPKLRNRPRLQNRLSGPPKRWPGPPNQRKKQQGSKRWPKRLENPQNRPPRVPKRRSKRVQARAGEPRPPESGRVRARSGEKSRNSELRPRSG